MRRQLLELPAGVVVGQHALQFFDVAGLYLSQSPPRIEDAPGSPSTPWRRWSTASAPAWATPRPPCASALHQAQLAFVEAARTAGALARRRRPSRRRLDPGGGRPCRRPGGGSAGAGRRLAAAGPRRRVGHREHRLDVAIVGDSFVDQAQASFLAHAQSDGTRPPRSAATWRHRCATRATSWPTSPSGQPRVLVVSFAGNDITPCMRARTSRPSPEETADEYRATSTTVLADFLAVSPATPVYVVPPPPIRDAQFE